jgi:tetratricopeptide (TPR) repeat protein
MQNNSADRRLEAAILYEEALARRAQGNPSGAFARYRLVLEIARELNDEVWEAQLLSELGTMYRDACELLDSRRWHREALVRFQELGDVQRCCSTLIELAHVERLSGDTTAAESLCREALASAIAQGDELTEALIRGQLGELLWALRREDEGMSELIKGLEIMRTTGSGEASGAVTAIRALRDRVGRIRYRKAVASATNDPQLLALLLE